MKWERAKGYGEKGIESGGGLTQGVDAPAWDLF